MVWNQLTAIPPRVMPTRIDPFDPVREQLAEVEAVLREVPEGQHISLTTAEEYLLSAGGKRIRPAVCLLTAGLFNHAVEHAVLFAAAVEMLHTATLVHDDLIDGSLLRRGVPTLNASWSPATTILVGDYLFARAADLAAATQNIRITELFAETLMVILNGEIAQSLTKWQVDRQEYYERIYAKTAAMFVLSTQGASILAGADEGTQQALIEFGRSIGMAFQIVDDVLDYIGREAQIGKPTGGDLRQGLITLPAICYHDAHPQDPDFETLMNGEGANQDLVQKIIVKVRESSAVDCALQEADDFLARGKRALGEFPHSTHKAALLEIGRTVVERAYKLAAP